MTQEELNKEMNEAIVKRNLQAIRILIKLGVDPNFKSTGKIMESLGHPSWIAAGSKNLTALHVSGEDPSLVKLLIDAGADVNAKNEFEETPLFGIGVVHESLELLIKAGADVNVKDSTAPLIHAVWRKNEDIVQTIINAGANLNVQDGYKKNTALHYAVEQNSKSLVQILIEAGADITLQNKDGKTPMDLVKTKTLRTFIENLLKPKALA